MFDKPTVVIMSGLPGSGKSTYVREIEINYRDNHNRGRFHVRSSDYFFLNMQTNTYEFDANRLTEAHAYTYRGFIEDIMYNLGRTIANDRKNDVIVVDNCGSKLHDVSPYILAAQAYGYDHLIVCCNASVETCIARQTHNVPEHTIRNMEKNLYDMYAKLPIGWKVQHINTEN